MTKILSQISFKDIFKNSTSFKDENNEYYLYAKAIPTFALPNHALTGMQQVNFFIGGNNSGKSRLIRGLHKWLRDYEYQQKLLPEDLYEDVFPLLSNAIETNFQYNKKEVFSHLKDGLSTSFNLNDLLSKPLYLVQSNKIETAQNEIKDALLSLDKMPSFIQDIQNTQKICQKITISLSAIQSDLKKKTIDDIKQDVKRIQQDIEQTKAFDSEGESLKHKVSALNNALKTIIEINPKYSNNTHLELEQSLEQAVQKAQSLFKDYEENPQTLLNIIDLSAKSIKCLETIQQKFSDTEKKAQSVLYIPVMRGLKILGEDVYATRIKKDYHLEDEEVFTGLPVYADLKTKLLGNHEERELVKGFEKLLSERFFENQSVTLIPKINADYVTVKIGNNKDLPIHELGDGLQALIVLLFPLYMRKEEDSFIFIEEPEMNLHPAWQREFLDIIQTQFPKHQFFITTHSNVFINTPNCSVYQVTRDHSSSISHVKHVAGNDKRGILSDLGYQASDVLQANYIVWVEGISDKIYIKKFLELYDKELVEGKDYRIFQYGGCDNFLNHFVISSQHLADLRQGIEQEIANSSTEKVRKQKEEGLRRLENRINLENYFTPFGILMDSDLESAAPQPKQEIQNSGEITKEERKMLSKYTTQENKKYLREKAAEANIFCWISEKRELENHIQSDVWLKACENYQAVWSPDAEKLTAENYDCTDFADRFKKSINDKIKMAEQVIEIIKTKSDLEADTELDTAMTNLVKAIRAANKKH